MLPLISACKPLKYRTFITEHIHWKKFYVTVYIFSYSPNLEKNLYSFLSLGLKSCKRTVNSPKESSTYHIFHSIFLTEVSTTLLVPSDAAHEWPVMSAPSISFRPKKPSTNSIRTGFQEAPANHVKEDHRGMFCSHCEQDRINSEMLPSLPCLSERSRRLALVCSEPTVKTKCMLNLDVFETDKESCLGRITEDAFKVQWVMISHSASQQQLPDNFFYFKKIQGGFFKAQLPFFFFLVNIKKEGMWMEERMPDV